VEAQSAFVEAVRAAPAATIRELVEPLGYHRRDVSALLASSPEFEGEYVEARGYDADTIRNEIRRRAIEAGSDRLLEFLGKMRLEEAQALLRTRFEGRLEVAAAPVIDPSKGSLEELRQLRALLAKFSPDAEQLSGDQRPALELLPGGEAAG